MKVLYDYRAWYMQKYGGVSRYFYEIIKHNTCAGRLHATIFAGLYQNQYGIENINNFNIVVTGKKISYPRKSARLFKFINELSFLGVSRFNSSQYDIYHPTYYYFHRPRINAMQVVTVHDMIHELTQAGILPGRELFKASIVLQEKIRTIRDADIVIAVSHSTASDIVNILKIERNKIRVVHLANSLNYEIKDPPIVDGPYILFVGGRSTYKNFITLLNAFARSTNINRDFKIVAFGWLDFSNDELLEIKKMGLTTKVQHIAGDDIVLSNLYKYAKVFVYPSLYEGFGIPPLEAMHYGCPVIASNRSSIPEVVGDAGILFDPTNIDELSMVIEKVLFNTRLREELIHKGYDREKLFNWEKTALETMDIYKEVSGQK